MAQGAALAVKEPHSPRAARRRVCDVRPTVVFRALQPWSGPGTLRVSTTDLCFPRLQITH